MVINSAANAQFKHWHSLLKPRGIRDAEEALIFGSKVTEEVAAEWRGTGQVLGWILPAGAPAPMPMSNSKVAAFVVSETLFAKLDLFGTGAPILWIKVPHFAPGSEFAVEPGQIGLVLPFQNPENVGALLRSAAAFGVRRVLLTEECAHPFHPKAVRAASGALPRMTFYRGGPLAEIQFEAATAVGLSAEGESIDRFAWPSGGILVPGIEGPGLPAALRRRLRLVSIPMAEGIESLNGMVAASLALYEWRRAASRS